MYVQYTYLLLNSYLSTAYRNIRSYLIIVLKLLWNIRSTYYISFHENHFPPSTLRAFYKHTPRQPFSPITLYEHVRSRHSEHALALSSGELQFSSLENCSRRHTELTAPSWGTRRRIELSVAGGTTASTVRSTNRSIDILYREISLPKRRRTDTTDSPGEHTLHQTHQFEYASTMGRSRVQWNVAWMLSVCLISHFCHQGP